MAQEWLTLWKLATGSVDDQTAYGLLNREYPVWSGGHRPFFCTGSLKRMSKFLSQSRTTNIYGGGVGGRNEEIRHVKIVGSRRLVKADDNTLLVPAVMVNAVPVVHAAEELDCSRAPYVW